VDQSLTFPTLVIMSASMLCTLVNVSAVAIMEASST
jgi:hypothetical protein